MGEIIISADSISWDFSPKPDITALESAYLGHFFAMCTANWIVTPDRYEHWDQIKRHFVEVKR